MAKSFDDATYYGGLKSGASYSQPGSSIHKNVTIPNLNKLQNTLANSYNDISSLVGKQKDHGGTPVSFATKTSASAPQNASTLNNALHAGNLIYENSAPNSAQSYWTDQMQFNHDEAQLSRDFIKWQMENSHQVEVEDLKKAGLNPILSANSGAALGSSATASSSDGKDIAKLNAALQLELAKINANSAQAVAGTYAGATMYAANQSLAASMYSADTNAAASKYNAYVNSATGILDTGLQLVGKYLMKK